MTIYAIHKKPPGAYRTLALDIATLRSLGANLDTG